MPLYDFQCRAGHTTEAFKSPNTKRIRCKCGLWAKRIISISGQFCANQDAPWLRTVLDVVDKTDRRAHVQNFVKNPTRENYKAWMKAEKIRPMDYTEHGAPPAAKKPAPVDLSGVRREMLERHMDRKRLEVRS